ncbi:MAG: 5' nucleotidase, NT5C type [Candidatus Woesearchaeota archaeon]
MKYDYLNNRKRPRVLLDMDDVIFGFLGELTIKINKHFNLNLTEDDLTEWDLEKRFGTEVLGLMKTPGFFENLKEKNDAINIIKEKYESGKYDIMIVTSSFPESYIEKIRCIKRTMPFFSISDRFISCSCKDAVWGDYLIDDYEKNLNAFYKIGTPICYDMPHNRHLKDKYKRVTNLKEAFDYIDAIEKEKYREPNIDIIKMTIKKNFRPKIICNNKIHKKLKFAPDDVTVEKRSSNPDKYAVIYGRNCMSKNGDFVMEPMPSTRTEDFLKEYRFDSVEEAMETFFSHYKEDSIFKKVCN